jgi:TonB-linked SusC/RagA family outer membrane protein
MFQPTSEFGSALVRGACGALGRVALALAVVFALGAPAQAQDTGSITGTVTSTNAEPLSGVVVQVRGLERSGLTNSEGRYLITNVPAGQYSLQATFIGYGAESQDVTVAAGGSVVADFRLQPRAVELEGVVVTGTAIASQRREVGNSIDLITSEDIEATGVSSVDEILRGRIQGLTVTGSLAQPGTGSNINIRGLTSINGRTAPLIFIDGVRVGTESGAFEAAAGDGGAATVLGSISPQDIERIEVIKGAAASSLYGTDATAGVIQIFTKKGQPGERARWTFNSQTAIITPSFVGPGEDIDPTGLHMNRCDINGPLPQDTIPGPDPDCPESGSWLRNAVAQNYAMQVRGGTDAFSYFASGGFERQEGVVNTPEDIDPQRADNVFIRANFGFDPFESLQVQINNAYTNREINFIPDGGNTSGLIFNVSRLTDGETPDDRDAQVFLQTRTQTIDQFTTSIGLNWTPMDNMRHRLNAGFDWSNSNQRTEFKRGHFNVPLGERTVDIENNRVITLDYAGSWFWELPGFNNFDFTTSWGGQLIDQQATGLRGDSQDFINRGRTVVEQGADFTNINEDRAGFINGGFFAQQRIGWNNQIFVTAGARIDSYNTIDELLNSRAEYQVFPRVQATYTLSDHSWWPSDIAETFRLRSAWGVAGDPPPQVTSRTLWDIRQTGRGSVGYVVDQIGNPLIGPERTSEFEVGLDASFFQGRINLSGQYFTRSTTDGLIFNDPIPSQGIIEPTPFNAGDWDTWGYETTLDVNVLELDNFRWNLNTVYQYTDNELNSIGLDEDGTFTFDTGVGTSGFRVGNPFPAVYRERILNPNAVGELPVYSDTVEFIGINIPPQEISINSNFGIGDRLNIDIFGYGQFGHVLLDGQAVNAAANRVWPGCVDVLEAMDAWRDAGSPDDAIPQFPAQEIGRCDADNTQTRDWYDDGDFFRLSSIAAQYRMPREWLPGAFTGATVQFRIQNLNLFTDFIGTDPDAIRGAGLQQQFREAGFVLPLPTTYQLNVRLNF